MPVAKQITRAYGGGGNSSGKGMNAMQEIGIGMGLGLVLGAVWKSWHFGQKSRMSDYYAK